MNLQVDLTSIFLGGSNQSDEPPLSLWAHLLSELDHHQGFDALGHAAGAPDFGPTLSVRSSTRFGDDRLLRLWLVPFTAALCTSSITSWLTHGRTGKEDATQVIFTIFVMHIITIEASPWTALQISLLLPHLARFPFQDLLGLADRSINRSYVGSFNQILGHMLVLCFLKQETLKMSMACARLLRKEAGGRWRVATNASYLTFDHRDVHAHPLHHDFGGTFCMLHTFLAIVWLLMGCSRLNWAAFAGRLTGGFALSFRHGLPRVLPLHVKNVRQRRDESDRDRKAEKVCTADLLDGKVSAGTREAEG